MGISRHLVCMDCGERIYIGDSFRDRTREDWPMQATTSLFCQSRDIAEDAAFLAHFLCRHMGHELRVIAYDNLVGDPPVYDDLVSLQPDRADHVERYFNLPVRFLSAKEELAEMPPEVIERLHEIHEGRKLHDPTKPYNENPRFKD